MADNHHISMERAARKAAFGKRAVRWVAVLCLMGLTGCAWSRPIYFKNPANGLTVVCGPYTHRDILAGKEKACVQRAADEGLVRIR